MSAVSIENILIVEICVTRHAERIISFVSLNALVDVCAKEAMQNPIYWAFVFRFHRLCVNGIDFGKINR